MKAYHNSVVLRNDGQDAATGKFDLNAGVTKQVTVRINSSQALAIVYDLNEVQIANPVTADNNGNYNFKAADDIYDVIISEGGPDEYKIEKVDIVEVSSLIDDLSQSFTFKSNLLMITSLIAFPVGKKIFWQGYYAESDGGSNWGIVKSGAHTDDGGSVFTLADGQYIAANLKGKTFSVLKFGAKDDGVSDSHDNIAKALDLALPIRHLTFPRSDTGVYYIASTILLPITPLNEGNLVLDFTGAKIIGPTDNSVTLFETANTSYSYNGTSNWADGPEVSIHSNTHLINLCCQYYDVALKLYNFNFNCRVSGSIGRSGKTFMHAKRSFYMTFTQNTVRAGYPGKPDDEPTILFEAFSNVMYVDDNHISNWDGTQATGVGIKFITGANAFNLSDGAVEGCKVGLWFSGENRPMNIDSVYFEANTKSMYHEDGALSGTVTNCWFADPVILDSDPSIASQLLFDKNYNVNNGSIIEASSVSTLQIRDGAGFANSSDYTAGVSRPANQQIAESAKYLNEGFQIAYNPVGGFAGAGARSTIPYNDMLMPFNYFGRLQRINTPIPFVDITWATPSLILDTQIQYLNNYVGGVVYDLTIFHSGGSDYLAGRTLGNGSVVQFDAVGRTVTTNNNSGFLRFTISGFGTASNPSIYGRIRAT